MVTVIKIDAKTIKSKKAFNEVKTYLPTATYKRTMHVAGMGYVTYIYDNAKEVVAHLFKSRDGLKLSIK